MMSGVKRVMLASIAWYQRRISPGLPPMCRYTPTCSAYAATAIERFGARRGGWLAAKRIARCAPWGGQGRDEVPLR
jgi:putative membrane protein insertion efficiency factor